MHTQTVSEYYVDMGQLSPYPKLFVVGCPRSGADLVTSLIEAHPDVVMVPGETHVYRLVYEPFIELPRWNWQRRFRSWQRILRRYGVKPLLFGWQPADIWPGVLRDYQILGRLDSHGLHGLVSYADLRLLIKAIRLEVPEINRGLVQAEELIAAMFDRFFEQYGQPGQTLLEATPMHIRYAEQILWRFPEARIIEVIRDGRDLCVSYNTSVKREHQAWMIDTIRQWKQYVQWGELVRERPGLKQRVHTVRYETLKADPERCLYQLCEFANLSWDEQHIQTSLEVLDSQLGNQGGDGQSVSTGALDGWESQLSETEVALCTEIAGDQLVRLGYMHVN